MPASSIRRPIPAIVFILLLSVVSGLVWWRVLHRDPAAATSTPSSTPAATGSSTPGPTHCVTVTAKPPSWPAPKTVTLKVLNAASKNGLAGRVTAAMKARGFRTAQPDNAPSNSVATEIRYGSRYVTSARLVQLYLPGSRLVSTASSNPTIVVAVGSSFKALATPNQVAAARAKAPAVRTCQ